jgi:hypothetical protein
MRHPTIARAALALIASTAMFAAQAQSTPTPTGEANDHTAANAAVQGTPKAKNATNNVNPGVVPPMVGEANDQTSPNATARPAGKLKAPKTKRKSARTHAPVTGEANDHSNNGGTTEAAKAAKDAKTPGM